MTYPQDGCIENRGLKTGCSHSKLWTKRCECSCHKRSKK